MRPRGNEQEDTLIRHTGSVQLIQEGWQDERLGSDPRTVIDEDNDIAIEVVSQFLKAWTPNRALYRLTDC